ncbi:MAG TPA: FHA domain-containing protein, partial [Pyrinomonadaceae bacterium]|nr:FHA domain-containing protein [Pyrinomonadaceae bacterium]
MVDVTLIINSPEGTRQITLPADRLTIGRTELSSVVINDEGLSRLHASINRDGDRVWILDENSTNGSRVNNAPVPPAGVLLRSGDQISIGNHTTIQVLFGAPVQQIDAARPQFDAATPDVSPVPHTPAPPSSSSSNLLLVTACVVIAVFLIGVAALGARAWRARNDQDAETAVKNKRAQLDEVDDADLAINENSSGDLTVINPTPAIVEQTTPFVPTSAAPTILSPTPQTIATVNSSVPLPTPASSSPGGRKLYVQMSEEEKMQFIEDSAQHVSTMMGNRPYAFTPEVLKYIKQYVDGYARRVGNNSTRLWGEDLRFMFARAREQFSPYI